MMRRGVAIGLVLFLASCARPPATAYDVSAGAATSGPVVAMGQNTAGEACTLQRNGGQADIYCGTWDQPSAQVQTGGAARPEDLPALATTSAWRAGLEGAYACAAPHRTTILGDVPAEVLSCTQRFGGWPHVALVSVIGNTAYYADGVLPALPPMQRALGVLSGQHRRR